MCISSLEDYDNNPSAGIVYYTCSNTLPSILLDSNNYTDKKQKEKAIEHQISVRFHAREKNNDPTHEL